MTATNVVGWPDLLLWNETQGRLIAAELKSEAGQPTPEQLEVLGSLARTGLVECYVWRPSNLDVVMQVLRPPRGVS